MARKGGNPDFGKKWKQALPEGVEKARTELFALRVSSELRDRLKAFSPEELREALTDMADRLEGKVPPGKFQKKRSLPVPM